MKCYLPQEIQSFYHTKRIWFRTMLESKGIEFLSNAKHFQVWKWEKKETFIQNFIQLTHVFYLHVWDDIMYEVVCMGYDVYDQVFGHVEQIQI